MGLIYDIGADLDRLGFFGRKEKPTRIYDGIEDATRLFTHVRLNGDLMPGVASFVDVPLYNGL